MLYNSTYIVFIYLIYINRKKIILICIGNCVCLKTLYVTLPQCLTFTCKGEKQRILTLGLLHPLAQKCTITHLALQKVQILKFVNTISE